MSDPLPEATTPRTDFAASVFGKYAVQLHRFLARRLRNPDAADDLAQEVFSRLARIEKSEFVRKPQAYLFGVAFHVVREFRARAERDLVTYDSETLDDATARSSQVVPDDLAERLSLQKQLEYALSQLPEHHRTVLLLCKRDGMTYEEAAAASGLSVHTVEKYLVQARARIMAMTWDR